MVGRNPLKSGQCFLRTYYDNYNNKRHLLIVAIPSNRVNVSYRETKKVIILKTVSESQSPQIGSMFLTDGIF